MSGQARAAVIAAKTLTRQLGFMLMGTMAQAMATAKMDSTQRSAVRDGTSQIPAMTAAAAMKPMMISMGANQRPLKMAQTTKMGATMRSWPLSMAPTSTITPTHSHAPIDA